MSTFSDVGLAPTVATPRSAQPEFTGPPRDLHEALERLDVADELLRSGQNAAGMGLLASTRTSMRSLLGDVEPDSGFRPAVFPVIAAPVGEQAHVLDVSSAELNQRFAGLRRRGVPLLVTVEHACTYEVLSRLRYIPAVDVTL